MLHTCERAHGNDFAQPSTGQSMLRHEARRRQGHKASALCGARPVQGGQFTCLSHTSVGATDSNGVATCDLLAAGQLHSQQATTAPQPHVVF